jgi:hypothetical protein
MVPLEAFGSGRSETIRPPLIGPLDDVKITRVHQSETIGASSRGFWMMQEGPKVLN